MRINIGGIRWIRFPALPGRPLSPSPTPNPGVEPDEEQLRQRRLLRQSVIFGGVLTLFVLVAVVAAFYLLNRQPVNDLPVVQQVARQIPPRRLFDFAGVTRPVGIAVSPDGQRIYVAEGGGERFVKVFDRDGKPLGQKLVPPGTLPGTRKPGHLATDAEGRVYVVDQVRGVLDTYGPALEWTGAWRPPMVDQVGGWVPNGVAVASDGRVVVSDVGRRDHAILVFSPDGILLDTLSKTSGLPGGLNYSVQAAVDDQGRTYIADGGNNRLLAVSPRGVETVGLSGDEALTVPMGLAVAGGKLYVADAMAHRIAVFATGDRPQYLHAFGDAEDVTGMAYPGAVTVDRSGRIYVADRSNDRVQVWTY